jgi:hypothetical protein
MVLTFTISMRLGAYGDVTVTNKIVLYRGYGNYNYS